jgi:endonuclease/exonuclease/phosphatase (EEP) superfamily protein YafD
MELFRAAAFLIAFASAAAAVLSLGGAFSDRLDILTHFTPLYFAGGVLALALAVAARTGAVPAVAASLVATLICGSIMAPEFLAAARAPSPSGVGKSLKLVQFNLWDRNFDPAGTARWIERQDADIVVVEEAVGAGAAVVQAIAPHYPYRATSSPASDGSTMILSKTRPQASGDLYGGGVKRFAGAWAKFGEGKAAFTVVAAHYTWPIPAGPQQAQSRRLSEFLNGLDRSSLIVAGDFNSTPWSFAMRRQDARFALARLTRAKFTWPTASFTGLRWLSPPPFLPLDHVYAGDAWRLAAINLGPPLGSDHLPVVVELTRVR